MEVNQALGCKYQVLAVASVKCWELVSSCSGGGKVHGKAVLVGVEGMSECVSVGSMEYWMRLKLPITQAAKLHQVSISTIAFSVSDHFNEAVSFARIVLKLLPLWSH